jgi:hypothetical protein
MSTGAETILKFNRMGFRARFGSQRLKMTVSGHRYLQDPVIASPEVFKRDVLSPDYEEYWIDGLQVYHNPRAVRPLDVRMFGDATHHFLRNGRLESIYVERSPFGLTTRTTVAAAEA